MVQIERMRQDLLVWQINYDSVIPLLIQLIDKPILLLRPGPSAIATRCRKLIVAFSPWKKSGAGRGENYDDVIAKASYASPNSVVGQLPPTSLVHHGPLVRDTAEEVYGCRY